MTTKERLEELFNDNENYIHSYTGTTMIDTEKVVPKILTMMRCRQLILLIELKLLMKLGVAI